MAAEGGQEFSLALLRMLQEAFLDRPEAADSVRDRRELDCGGVAYRR